jgi:hypothetical protein
MNEEGRLRNVVSPAQTTPSDSYVEAYAAAPSSALRWKGKSSKAIICHKCGGVGHIRPHCPTLDSDAQAANVMFAVDGEKEVEEQAFTAIVDEFEEAW